MNCEHNLKVKQFWENCPEHFSHTNKDYKALVRGWRRAFVTLLDFNNKTILDYGIGASYFGYYLLKNFDIKHYYGLDIAERSIKKAKNLLSKNNFTKFSLHNITENREYKNIDILVCQQVVQHFADKETLDNFLDFIVATNPQQIMLQFQLCLDKDNKYEFNGSRYKTTSDVVRACRVNEDYVFTKLHNYSLMYKNIFDTPHGKTSCFAIMTRSEK